MRIALLKPWRKKMNCLNRIALGSLVLMLFSTTTMAQEDSSKPAQEHVILKFIKVEEAFFVLDFADSPSSLTDEERKHVLDMRSAMGAVVYYLNQIFKLKELKSAGTTMDADLLDQFEQDFLQSYVHLSTRASLENPPKEWVEFSVKLSDILNELPEHMKKYVPSSSVILADLRELKRTAEAKKAEAENDAIRLEFIELFAGLSLEERRMIQRRLLKNFGVERLKREIKAITIELKAKIEGKTPPKFKGK